jgi:hypothetical protein
MTMKYELPEHTTHKGEGTVVLAFTEPLTAADATLVHKHLATTYPGAGITTTGDNQVTVTPVPRPPRTARKKS